MNNRSNKYSRFRELRHQTIHTHRTKCNYSHETTKDKGKKQKLVSDMNAISDSANTAVAFRFEAVESPVSSLTSLFG